MPKITVNGRAIEAPPGKKLLEVLVAEGITVPYYCWHPGLKPHGNCRMCLVKVSNSRKLEVSCMWPVTDGLEVTTESPEIDTARKAVLEYMLINHPLDCPICDKAGECMLQDHTFNYRKGVSRFQEDKVLKGTWDLGPNVRIWGNRCISCTRCVRFCDDIAGTGELSITQRGDHSVADVHPDIPLNNPMSLNTVDICPVGALIDKNFMYQARVWFADRKESVCASCSRGCNVTSTVHNGEIKRLQPRHNAEVNDYWMCDGGRLNTKYVTSEARLKARKGALHDLVSGIDELGPGRLGILASTYATVEELFLVEKLASAVRAKVAFLTKTEGERWVSKSGFAIETDKTPNTRGAEQRFGSPLGTVDDMVRAIEAGEVTGLLVLNGIPDVTWSPKLVSGAKGLKFLAVADILDNPLVAAAQVVIPSACWAEKEGTYVNRDGRLQRIRTLVPAPGEARSDITWLQELLVAMGQRPAALSTEGVFRQAMPGLDYKQVGSQGVVPGAEDPTPAVPGSAHLGAK